VVQSHSGETSMEITVYSEPVTLKFAGWAEATYDAQVLLDGMKWLRAKTDPDDFHPLERWVLFSAVRCCDIEKRILASQKWKIGLSGRAFSAQKQAMRAAVNNDIERIEAKIQRLKDDIAVLHNAKYELEDSVRSRHD
jgi:hypothetical protein